LPTGKNITGHQKSVNRSTDSNSLDRNFYAELLHIMGLTEIRKSGKNLIERKKESERNAGSLLENAIARLEELNRTGRNQEHSAEICQAQVFHTGLELVITWINRILFLKLLEARLLAWHNGDRSYAFLHIGKIENFDALDRLFFGVLSRKREKRDETLQNIFEKVPYLNTSLFEITEIEQITFSVIGLDSEKSLPLFPATVLRDRSGKKRTGEMNTLEYMFAFLDAYDFSSEGAGEIQDEKKSLISASVLGLIFEKINGYRDGSYFTPGFVTMYMCCETVRRAVVQKFNEKKGWKCREFDELYNKIEDIRESNEIVNSLKICDPAVGSGHFLVSALNEIIAVKNDLKILQDRDGKRLKEYHAEVVNDEIIITDEDGKFFHYSPKSRESQRVQEALFHEKQTIIENCLFGVDINPNSVKICRLRLWIELLKNAYYKEDGELETLPNIDINIRCGNSLTDNLYFKFSELLSNNNFLGFDIVIGNPPYGITFTAQEKEFFRENYESAITVKDQQKGSTDSFSLFMDRGLQLCSGNAMMAYIVPLSFVSGESMSALHSIIFRTCETVHVSTYSNRPQKIFENADQRTAIVICHKNGRPTQNLYTTKVNKRYRDTPAADVIKHLQYVNSYPYVKYGRIPKVGSETEIGILQELFSIKIRLSDLFDKDGLPVYYRTSGGRYYNIITNFKTGSTKENRIFVKAEYRDIIGAVLSSNLYYWFYHIYSNNLDLKSYELEIFPVPADKFTAKQTKMIEKLYKDYLADLKKNSKVKKADYATIDSYREYYARYSKHFIDKIDLAIQHAYGLTDEEIRFIIAYDLEFRTDDAK